MSYENGVTKLKESIEELTFFTLQGYLDQKLEFDLALPWDFCSALLGSAGCKNLALALFDFISGEYLQSHFNENEEFKQLGEKVKKHGEDLLACYESVDIDVHVQEPYFTQLKDGSKTIEGRCAVDDYNKIQPGDVILFNKVLLCEVQNILHYKSFHEMLNAEELEKVLPGVKTIEEGVAVYRSFYNQSKEKLNGVLAIHITKMATQPCLSLAQILSDCGCSGVQKLIKQRQLKAPDSGSPRTHLIN